MKKKGAAKSRQINNDIQNVPNNFEPPNSTPQANNSQNAQNSMNNSNQSNVILRSNSSHATSQASFSLNASSSRTSKKVIQKSQIFFGDDKKMIKNKLSTNRVRTKRYTMLSWAPLSLLFQFKRAANIYFLIISVLTAMPFSPKEPSSMIGTFAMVLFFTMLKEAYEDYQRHKQDKEVNKKKAKIFDPIQGKFMWEKWENIKLGNIVRVEKDQEVPTDIMVLYSSNVTGLVFVDTMNLDGETNLKEKMATCENFDEKLINEVNGEIICDAPNEHLEFWEANINCSLISSKVIQLSIKNLLLRGSYIRNTSYTYGIVVYTGMETKIMKNMKKPPHKVSNVMKKMNKMLYTVFAFQILIILLFATLNNSWAKQNVGKHPETNTDQMNASTIKKSFIIQLLTFWVAYSHMIPISLYVIIELLKLGQAYLINKDVQIYDKETESFSKCRNSDLIEELGQVEMIFSDKTGTLTKNKMIFKKCQINGTRYGDPDDSEQMQIHEGMCDSGIKKVMQKLQLEQKAQGKKQDGIKYASIHYDFFKALTLCHTVVCDIDSFTKEIRYQASSPDELALVLGAKEIGMELVARNHSKLEIENKITDNKEIYKVVAEFPFDSTRKCMSVIVQDQYDQYSLYCKGADSVMLEKINFEKSNKQDLKERVELDLHQYSCEGLRTLVMAMRSVPEKEFNTFNDIFTKLRLSNHPYKEKKIKELFQKMEQKLRYLGCTAIEDKLQDGVPSTIAKLIEADIRFWMLTGDKLETAIEIAKSCKVIQENMHILTLSTNDFEAVNRILESQIEQFDLNITEKVKTLKNYEQQNIVIAIDGSTLNLVLEDPELEQKFFYVSLIAKSVVCCRVSPKQKADIVTLYKKRGQWITLSIGDGANDVSMILEAHIGVGIKGKEGTQAVRSADYSISQFRFLQKLLLCHGRWGYRRVAKMICYYFYKNIILVFTEIYFAYYNGFSGQIYFLDWLPMLYNAVFTSWQCLFAFLLEQDVNSDYSYKHPNLYKAGQQGRYFTFGIFWRQIVFALWHGVVCFFAPIYGFHLHPNPNGIANQHWFGSTVSFTLIIHLVCYKLFVESNYWNVFSFVSAIISLLFYYILTFLGSSNSLASALQPQLNGLMIEIVTYPLFYLVIIVVPFICLIPDLTYKYGRALFTPYPGEIIMIEQKKNPNYVYYDETLKKEITKFLSGVIKKNQSVGQLTQKALSEIDKQSLTKRSYDNLSYYQRSPEGKQIQLDTQERQNILGERTDSSKNMSPKFKIQAQKKTNDKIIKEKKNKGGDTSHILNDQNLSDNELMSNHSSKIFQQAFNQPQAQKTLKTHNNNQQKEDNEHPDKMKSFSYKERKRKLVQNIKQEMQEMKEPDIVKINSFHDTKYNNIIAATKLDLLIKQTDHSKSKKQKQKNNNNNEIQLYSIFGADQDQKKEKQKIPMILNETQNAKDSQIDREQLQELGHPLEKQRKTRKSSKKKYVEKYRQLIQEEKESFNDFNE